jgi:hypothetical protein
MEQFILHLIGDYLLQNNWISLNKKKAGNLGSFACHVHCILYSAPFLFIGSWKAVFIIYFTHYIIDRHFIVSTFTAIKNGIYEIDNYGYGKTTDKTTAMWLHILNDNTLHMVINFLALKYV